MERWSEDPLFEHGPVVAFDLAVSAGRVGLNEDGFGANLSQGSVVVVAVAVGPGVVGHDGLEADVAFGKPGQSSPEEAADSHRLLVIEQLAVSQARVVIYERVEAFVSDSRALLEVPPRSALTAIESVATAFPNSRQLLHV